MALRFRRQAAPNVLEEGGTGASQRLAYTLLEAARIQCEKLQPAIEPCDALRTLHRDLGLAGYHVCAEFQPEIRERCLEIARHDGDAGSHGDPRMVVEIMFEEVIAACDAITEALSTSAEDHLHAAHIHVMSASESLDRLLTLVNCAAKRCRGA